MGNRKAQESRSRDTGSSGSREKATFPNTFRRPEASRWCHHVHLSTDGKWLDGEGGVGKGDGD